MVYIFHSVLHAVPIIQQFVTEPILILKISCKCSSFDNIFLKIVDPNGIWITSFVVCKALKKLLNGDDWFFLLQT